MADMFTDSSDQTVTLGLNDLVGEDKKYKDPDALAQAYANVESFAETLKRENAELRAAKDVEDARLNNQTALEAQEREKALNLDKGSPPPDKNSSTSEVDFRSQIREEIKALSETDRAQANLDVAATRMAELYGSEDGARDAIQKRARELGVSVEWLRDSAGKSPEAFYATMGVVVPTSRSTPAPTSEIRLASGTSNAKDFEYFDKLRRDNPKLYFTADTQKEMMSEARRQGEGFYRT